MKFIKETEKIIIKFEENITAKTVKDLKEEIQIKLGQEAEYKEAVADLSEVEYIDSTGITLIIGIYKSLESSNKLFSVIGTSEEIKNLFEIIRLDKIFSVK
ncbi:STAS domain-containing protein [Tindallia californiensis]|uniref:Anti-sigma factor antagonist n=1 Tax=Tindallia californiensis TaxID=159292 RepID=A0A1H3I5A8_9FIRM|nr:STAS domain-containing protein [Tindallia californiensis]SDY22811.1 anti-sigma B factor antagonist [Tindallia californiensis]